MLLSKSLEENHGLYSLQPPARALPVAAVAKGIFDSLQLVGIGLSFSHEKRQLVSRSRHFAGVSYNQVPGQSYGTSLAFRKQLGEHKAKSPPGTEVLSSSHFQLTSRPLGHSRSRYTRDIEYCTGLIDVLLTARLVSGFAALPPPAPLSQLSCLA